MADPTQTPLSRRAEALRERMGEYPAADLAELQGLERERGWLEAVAHLSRHGGLSHAGQVEARKMVAASGDWFRELAAWDDGPER